MEEWAGWQNFLMYIMSFLFIIHIKTYYLLLMFINIEHLEIFSVLCNSVCIIHNSILGCVVISFLINMEIPNKSNLIGSIYIVLHFEGLFHHGGSI